MAAHHHQQPDHSFPPTKWGFKEIISRQTFDKYTHQHHHSSSIIICHSIIWKKVNNTRKLQKKKSALQARIKFTIPWVLVWMLNTALLEALWWAESKFNYNHTSHRVILHCLCWKSILITIKLWNSSCWWNKQTKENFTCSTRNCACRNRVSSVKVRQFTGGTDVCSKKGMTKI